MFKNEDDFKKIVSRLNIDDAPNEAHRQNLRRQMLSAFTKSRRDVLAGTISWQTIGSRIMKNPITKLTAAAVIIIAVSLFSWFNRQQASPDKTQFASGLSFLSRACAAEQVLFSGSKITHILNEIIVYPVPEEKPSSELLDELDLTPEQREYLETVNSWLDYDWLPLCSLQANGEFRYNQLKLSKDINQSFTITDEAWYEPATGHFARVMKTGQEVIFANSFDGEFIYFSEKDATGSLRLLSERVREGFKPPQNPAEFLGITAGLQSSIQKDDFQPPVLEVTEDKLDDGTPVSIYKLGFVDLMRQADTYWLFKIRNDNNIVAEMEFVLAGTSQLLIRRALSETVDKPEVSWGLAQIDLELQKSQESPKVAIAPDVYRSISIQHMIDNAGFETYIFAMTPSWTKEPEIGDMADFASPNKRMFVITYSAADNRHLIMCQSETFNSFFASILKWAQQYPIYTSSNDFKVWHGGPEKWWTEMHLRSCGFTPAEDRTGYVLESPTGTYLSLAINDILTDEELHSLIDSLITTKEYQKNLMKGKSDE